MPGVECVLATFVYPVGVDLAVEEGALLRGIRRILERQSSNTNFDDNSIGSEGDEIQQINICKPILINGLNTRRFLYMP